MTTIEWTTIALGTAVLITAVGIAVILQILRKKKPEFPLQEERTASQELLTLGSSLVVLGIVFGTDSLISYSFIGTGVSLSIISVIKLRRKEQRSSVGMR